ncbi:hypothetical protein [Salinimicrobium oceani]|uniref:YD repeat-containing protein n=1 Tax=Salinimicrobium oceani TaxID=2722702 RepID=A0ABX1CZF8_9FLAO|nr:hypothetical protein [Salinimicrobium oceani]NJW53646.1 hypothetical protein [Salinimicrobium oceani]
MEKLLINLLLIFCVAFNASSQSLSSARSNIFDQYTTKFGHPREIRNTNTFYNDSGKEVKEEKIIFSKSSDTISELRYKNSLLDARLIFIFDKEGKLILRTLTNKIPLVGWQSQKAEYRYGKNGLTAIINYNSNDVISGKAIFKNDSKGNPVSMELYDQDSRLLGYEKAEYNYEDSTYTYKVYDSSNNLQTSKEYEINSERPNSSEYNEIGDVILYRRNWNENDNTFYLIEYKYDELGNWIDKKIFTIEKKGDKFVKKKKNKRFKRKIKYW